MKTKILSLTLFLFACTCLLTLIADQAYCQKKPSEKKISVVVDYVSKGDMSIILNDVTLAKFLPELKEPRLFNVDDIKDKDEKGDVIRYGYSFVVQGNFIKDGYEDLAFVVKDQDGKICLVILHITGKIVTREYYSWINDRVAPRPGVITPQIVFIEVKHNFMPGIDAILAAYAFGTDWCDLIYWNENKKKYVVKACAEFN